MSNSAAHPDPSQKVTRRAVIVWGSAVLFYILAITGRTSFGVAGVDAIERFEIDASRIAVFTAVQLAVYSLSQIPVGLLIDRFGSRKVLNAGAIIMAVGQITLGLTTNYGVAIGARVLIGAGDATAFLSAMRLLPYWFPARTTPLFGQLTAGLGQLGQFLSAVPFLALLNSQGWTTAFVSLGAVGALVILLAGIAISDAPEGSTDDADKTDKTDKPGKSAASADSSDSELEPGQLPEKELERKQSRFLTTLTTVLRHPVAWQAFFIHWAGMLNQIVFTLIWGVPLMSLGMGMSAAQVGMVLTINTIASVCSSFILGPISQRAGRHRDLAVIALAGTIGVSWLIFLWPEEPRSMAAIIILNVIMALFTPTSNFGFDNVRARVDRRYVATATGLGNMGGFLAGMLAAQLVGLSLDTTSAGGAYEWADFRSAWVIVLGIWLIAILGILVSRLFIKKWEQGGEGGRVKIVDKR